MKLSFYGPDPHPFPIFGGGGEFDPEDPYGPVWPDYLIDGP